MFAAYSATWLCFFGYIECLPYSQIIVRKLLEYLTLNSGRKVNSVEEVDWLYDTLTIEKLYNKVNNTVKTYSAVYMIDFSEVI